jgi:hypothetical protein
MTTTAQELETEISARGKAEISFNAMLQPRKKIKMTAAPETTNETAESDIY